MDISTVDHLLTTTRAVRKRLDFERPVEPEVIEECIEIALQAPVGGLDMKSHFVVVADPVKRMAVADLYRKSCLPHLKRREKKAEELGEQDPRSALIRRSLKYTQYQAETLHKNPVLIIMCFEGRVEGGGVMEQASMYGSLLPAAWSLMLALRSRGLGSSWTTLHLAYEKETAKVLGIPDDVTQAVLLPVAYYTGADFRPGKRLPAREQTHWDTWGNLR